MSTLYFLWILVPLLVYLLILLYLSLKERRSQELSKVMDIKKKIGREKIRLGLHNKMIKWNCTMGLFSSSKKVGKDSYLISFGKKATVSTIKHELYHIYRGDCDKAEGYGLFHWIKIRLILYPFLFELRAKVYAVYEKRL